MPFTQSERIRIQVKIMSLRAQSALCRDEPAFKDMYDALISAWEAALKDDASPSQKTASPR